MTPDPTIRGLLYRADVAADVAAALVLWAAYELDSATRTHRPGTSGWRSGSPGASSGAT